MDVVLFIAVSGKVCHIKIYNLRNGADTYLRLVDGDNTVSDTNSNPIENGNTVGKRYYADSLNIMQNINTGDVLASRIDFTALTSKTYHVETSTATSTPLSDGKYGEFTLRITETSQPSC